MGSERRRTIDCVAWWRSSRFRAFIREARLRSCYIFGRARTGHPLDTENATDRIAREARHQNRRMEHALAGELELRDRFYFINRAANARYDGLLAGLKGKRVVVVGSSDCGVTPLAREGVYVEGTDISPLSIEKLQRSIEKEGLGEFASARVMNAEDLQYAPASLDMITCSGVLHHIDTEKALRSWARSLKPDGAVVLFEPLALHPFVALFRVVTPHMRTPDEHPLRTRDFRLMAKYFAVVQRSDYGLLTPLCAGIAMIPGLRRVAVRLLPWLEAADSGILKRFPLMGNFCWLTVVRLARPVDRGP